MIIVEVLAGGVRGGTAILYAALGETLAERAGVINLGTEGSMLAGCLAAYAITAETGSPWAGLVAGMLAGALLAAVHAFMVLARGANQLATGLVVLFLGGGLTAMFGAAYVGQAIEPFRAYPIPILSDLPVLGPILFSHDPLVYLSYLLAPALWWLLFRSRWGLVVRGAGERPAALATYGHSPALVRYLAVVGGGLLAGVGGAHLSTAYANAWFENMTAGRGFIAVALVIFAAWHPLRAVGGAYLFGAALALSPALQARGFGFNQFALDALPYLVTIAALIVLGRRRVNAAPEDLSRVSISPPLDKRGVPMSSLRGLLALAAAVTVLAGCATNSSTAAPGGASSAAPGTGGDKIGFIFVGPKDDYAPNFGTYFGTVYEPVYLAGIVAGKATRTNKLGYVYAFPISQTLDNINAFQLGAASVNPQAKTYVVNTSSWCDPAKQAEAAKSLLSQGVDVISQHQDCTATVIRATETAGKFTVGYHADATALAPKGWLTGSHWNWGPLYAAMVKTILAGSFTGSPYNANFRVGLKTGDNPFVQSPYGPTVTDETKKLVQTAMARISKDGSPFLGPVVDQDGKERVPAGTVPDYKTIESIDYFVTGVVGKIPAS